MTALEIYRAQYEEERTWNGTERKWTKYEWAAYRVFDLTTYDGGLDERFVKDILEVCKVILEDRNYEYIEDEKNYVKFILVCQLLDRNNWIEWGSSIRGAWLDVDHSPGRRSRDILEALEWSDWDPVEKKFEEHKIEAVPFSVENLKALIEFMGE